MPLVHFGVKVAVLQMEKHCAGVMSRYEKHVVVPGTLASQGSSPTAQFERPSFQCRPQC